MSEVVTGGPYRPLPACGSHFCHFLAGPYAALALAISVPRDQGSRIRHPERPAVGLLQRDESVYFRSSLGPKRRGIRLASPEDGPSLDLVPTPTSCSTTTAPGHGQARLDHATWPVNPASSPCAERVRRHRAVGRPAGYDYTDPGWGVMTSPAAGPAARQGRHSSSTTPAACRAWPYAPSWSGAGPDSAPVEWRCSTCRSRCSLPGAWQMNAGSDRARRAPPTRRFVRPELRRATALSLFVGNDPMWAPS